MPDKKIRDWKKLILGASVAVLGLAAVLLILANIFTGNSIRKGIRIEQTDVSWLSVVEAKALVSSELNRSYLNDDITLLYGNRQWNFKLADIDYKFLVDNAVEQAFSIGRTGSFFQKAYHSLLLAFNGQQLEVGVSFQKDEIQAILKKIKNEYDSIEKNAEIAYINGAIKLTRENLGRRLDIDRNTELIENKLKKREFGFIELQVNEIRPHIVFDEIKYIDSVISRFNTRFDTGETNRSDNIRLACSRIDNRILLPGEEFSMNEALGPRTVENGYKEASVILNSELIDGIGGGVCQVSSTMYNAVLLAGLEVTERVRHSIPLSYIKPGRDATINEDTIDFRFINNSDYAIYLQADVKGNILDISILGKRKEDGHSIKLRTEVIAEYPPEQDEVIPDDTLQFGEVVVVRKAIKGLRVILFREIYSKGTLLRREKLTEDFYKPVKGKVRVNRDFIDIYLTTTTGKVN